MLSALIWIPLLGAAIVGLVRESRLVWLAGVLWRSCFNVCLGDCLSQPV